MFTHIQEHFRSHEKASGLSRGFFVCSIPNGLTRPLSPAGFVFERMEEPIFPTLTGFPGHFAGLKLWRGDMR